MRNLSHKLYSRATNIALAFVVAVSGLTAVGPFLYSQTASAVAGSEVVYDALPSVTPSTNYVSLGYQATSTAELGDRIQLGGSNRVLDDITVTLSNWAKYADYSANPTYSGNSTSYNHDITVNVYETDRTPIASKTQSVSIPWRPASDPTCAATSNGTGWKEGDVCYDYSGIASNATFDFSTEPAVVLPSEVIVSVEYNTQTRGYSPLGVAGPYDSLNVAIPDNQPVSVGADLDATELYWYTTNTSWYSDGVATASFRSDKPWTPNGTIALKITAEEFGAPTNLTPANGSATTNDSFDNTWTAVPGAAKYEYYTTYNNGTQVYTDTSDAGNYDLSGSTIVRHNSGAPESTYTWKVRAIDPYGNPGPWSDENTVTVDKSAPSKPVLDLPSNGSYLTTNDFYFDWNDSTDATTLTYEFQSSQDPSRDLNGVLNGSNIWTSGTLATSDIHSIGAGDGPWFYQVRAKDAAGNYSQWSDIWSVIIDTTRPAAPTLVTPSPYIANGASKTLTWNPSASSDVVSYEYAEYNFTAPTSDTTVPSWVKNIAAPTTTTTDTAWQSDIQIFWRVRAVDAAGNKSDWSETRSIISDRTKPTIVASDASYYNPASLTLTAADGIGVKRITGNLYNGDTNVLLQGNSSTTQNPFTVTLSTLADGYYYVRYNAQDQANNVSATSQFYFVVDHTAPTAEVSYSTEALTADPVTATLTFSEPVDEASLTGWTKVSSTEYTKVYAENTTETVTFKDLAGNEGSQEVAIDWIDITPPEVTITNPADGDVFGNDASVTIVATLTDAQGNVVSYTVTITGPEGVQEFGGTGSGVFTNWSTAGLASGEYDIVVTAYDEVGNLGTSETVTVTIDNEGPALTVNGYTGTDITPTLTGTTDGADDVVTVDGVEVDSLVFNGTTYTWSYTLPVQATGTRTLEVIATDSFGNQSVEEATVTVIAVAPLENGDEDTEQQAQTVIITPATNNDQGVLGDETETPSEASENNVIPISEEGDQDVAAATDTNANNGTILGLAWYWWLIILALLGGLAAWIAATYRKRSAE